MEIADFYGGLEGYAMDAKPAKQELGFFQDAESEVPTEECTAVSEVQVDRLD